MQKNLISIVIPCYNTEKFLSDCVKSLDSQTYKNFEAIFVDDGSTDGTLALLNTLCAGKENYKVFSKENGGVSSARNFGIAHANGEFIQFLDSDDMLAPNHLEVLIENIKDYGICMVGHKNVKENDTYDKIAKFAKVKKSVCFNGKENITAQFLSSNKFIIAPWNKLFRHEIIKKFKNYPNIFDEKVSCGEDALFEVEYFLNCENANLVNAKTYYYRKRKSSLSFGKFKKNLLDVCKVHEKTFNLCKDYPLALQYAKAFVATTYVDLLFRIAKSDFDDKAVIKKIYNDFKENSKVLKKCKKIHFYHKLVPLAIPVLKIMLNKKLK